MTIPSGIPPLSHTGIPSSSYRILDVTEILNKASLSSVALDNEILIEHIRTKKVIKNISLLLIFTPDEAFERSQTRFANVSDYLCDKYLAICIRIFRSI